MLDDAFASANLLKSILCRLDMGLIRAGNELGWKLEWTGAGELGNEFRWFILGLVSRGKTKAGRRKAVAQNSGGLWQHFYSFLRPTCSRVCEIDK